MSFLTIVPIAKGWDAHTASGWFQCVPKLQPGLVSRDRQRRLTQHSPRHCGAAFLKS